MNYTLRGILSISLLSIVAASQAATLISQGDSYQYVNATAATVYGGDLTNWETTGYDDSGWFTGNALFGNANGGIGDPVTEWTVDYDPLLRKTITLSQAHDNVVVNIAIDNGYDLYVDGALVSSNNAEGYTFLWEYSFGIGSLSAGTHVFALQLEDHGGVTGFDMLVTGDPVPEPATLAALGAGLAAMASRRRRKA